MGGRVPAFMGLAQATGGVYLEEADKPLNVEQAMRDTGLDFDVKLEKIQAVVEEPVVTDEGPTTVTRTLDMPRYRAIHRPLPGRLHPPVRPGVPPLPAHPAHRDRRAGRRRGLRGRGHAEGAGSVR